MPTTTNVKQRMSLLFKTPTFLRQWNRCELIALFIAIPALQISIFFLSAGIKQDYFILSLSHPNIFSMFLSSYTHSDASHIQGNLIVYAVIILLLLAVKINKMFRAMVLFLFTVLPWLISLSSIYFDQSISTGQGFSGIVAGFIGYFTYSTCNHVKNSYSLPLNTTFVLFILMLNLAITFLFFGAALTTLYGLLLISLSAVFGYTNRAGLTALLKSLRAAFRNLKYASRVGICYSVTFFLMACIMIFSLPFLVARNTEGSSIAHYVGYVFGIYIPLILEFLANIRHSAKIGKLH